MIDRDTTSAVNDVDPARVNRGAGPRNRRRFLASQLRRSPAFAHCTERVLRTVVRDGSEVVIPAHWAFIHEATPAHAAYVLLDGEATVYRGQEPVATATAGDVVGELGLLLRHRLRTATVTSASRITALRVDYATLAGVLDDEPNLDTRLRAIAAARGSGYPPWCAERG